MPLKTESGQEAYTGVQLTGYDDPKYSDPVMLAKLVAAKFCKNNNRKDSGRVQIDFEEVVSAAWERIDHDIKRGILDSRTLYLAGLRGIQDYLRTEYGNGGYGKSKCLNKSNRVVNISSLVKRVGYNNTALTDFHTYGAGLYGVLDPKSHYNSDNESDAYSRMLQLWGETKYRRRTLSMKERVIFYLYYIESMNQKDIGKYFGCSESRVNQIITTAENIIISNGYIERKEAMKTPKYSLLREDGSHPLPPIPKSNNAHQKGIKRNRKLTKSKSYPADESKSNAN